MSFCSEPPLVRKREAAACKKMLSALRAAARRRVRAKVEALLMAHCGGSPKRGRCRCGPAKHVSCAWASARPPFRCLLVCVQAGFEVNAPAHRRPPRPESQARGARPRRRSSYCAGRCWGLSSTGLQTLRDSSDLDFASAQALLFESVHCNRLQLLSTRKCSSPKACVTFRSLISRRKDAKGIKRHIKAPLLTTSLNIARGAPEVSRGVVLWPRQALPRPSTPAQQVAELLIAPQTFQELRHQIGQLPERSELWAAKQRDSL